MAVRVTETTPYDADRARFTPQALARLGQATGARPGSSRYWCAEPDDWLEVTVTDDGTGGG
ncbi:hypothetical protein [Streptomyces vilmorinianum]|uniref:hypothetical protein n=1 Tax=Streptomyces vilmorinianum TaxID=3051092 RepID=UPI0010FBA672|nr:hypothetical protein [Streptomyces vilmorinianum]